MESHITEIHQVGSQMIHVVRDKIAGSEEYLGLIEGGGVCLAQSFSTPDQAENWLHSMFKRLFRDHTCGLGCIRVPGSEFLAGEDALERLTRLPDSHLS